jgi:DNA-binding MarR family transcriptional regulator
VAKDAADPRRVFDDLVRFETVLWNAVDGRMRLECGLDLGSFNVMLVIASTPSCRVCDIATALAITVGGTSQAVDRLEARGHCVRRPNPFDRRSSLVELTPAGRELFVAAQVVFDRELETFLCGPLSAGALNRLAAALATLRAAATHQGDH